MQKIKMEEKENERHSNRQNRVWMEIAKKNERNINLMKKEERNINLISIVRLAIITDN